MKREQNKSLLLKGLGEYLRSNKYDSKIIQESGFFNPNRIEFGLVSGFAVWSGGTFAFGKRILNEISSDSGMIIPIYLLDCDFILSEIQMKLFNSSSWGYFESVWIESGQIMIRYKYSFELEPFIKFVNERLSILGQSKKKDL